jgi:DNA mismatch endonuclease (patch repair protein)
MPGKPDIVLPKYKTIIFIHGCFWHGHEGCKYFVKPKSNVSYWLPKIEKNINRDIKSEELLKLKNWKIIKIWECDLKKINIENTLRNLIETLKISKE